MFPTVYALAPTIALFVSLQSFATPSQNVVADVKVQILSDSVSWNLVVPKDTKLNFEGPWSLRAKGNFPFTPGVEFSLGKAEFDQEKSRYLVPLLKKAEKGQAAEYKLVYFLCSKDNTWCKRIVFEGKIQQES
jgi:hypothetical protein